MFIYVNIKGGQRNHICITEVYKMDMKIKINIFSLSQEEEDNTYTALKGSPPEVIFQQHL